MSEARRHGRNYVTVCLAAFLLRVTPNLLAGAPLGYDTPFYAAFLERMDAYLASSSLIVRTPLLYLIAFAVHVVTGLPSFDALSLLQPILFAGLAVAFYYAAHALFDWRPSTCLLATALFILQTTTLRIGWDLLKNELGLILLLLAVPQIARPSRRRLLGLGVAAVLLVLTHQLTPAILFAIVLGVSVHHLAQGEHRRARNLVVAVLPALVLLLGVLVYHRGLAGNLTEFANVVYLERLNPSFPFVNYLAGEGIVDYEGSYLRLLVDVAALFLASFGVLLPLAYRGFAATRSAPVDLWTGCCGFAAFSCLYTPEAALVFWHRWMNLLVVPVTLYAVRGLMRVRHRARPLTLGVLLVTGVLAGLYVTSTPDRPFSTYGVLSNTSRYAPSAYLRNTVPLGDTADVHAALTWLNPHLVDGACLLTRETFTYWAVVTLDPEKTIVSYGTSTVEAGLQGVSTMGFDDVYWIWWEDGVGQQWYQQSVPPAFTPIHRSGAIVIFQRTA